MAKKKTGKPGLMTGSVAAGFPSPAGQYVETPLDLNELLVRKLAATFFVRAAEDSMVGAGIRSGDILWLTAAWQLPTIPSSLLPWTMNSPSTHRPFLPAASPGSPAERKAASGALQNRLCGRTKCHRRYLEQ